MNLTGENLIPGRRLARLVGALAVAGVGAAGCNSTAVTVVGHPHPAVPRESVRIYTVPPKSFEVVAQLQTDAKHWENQADMEAAMEVFQAKAGKLGANGVLLLSVRAERNGRPVEVGRGPFIEGELGNLPSQIVRAQAIVVPAP